MIIKKLPKKYERIWNESLPLLRNGRPGDDIHAGEVVNYILDYKGRLKIDYDILVPVAMMHDIGHSAILSKHFRYITGLEKVANGKLVHMLAGAKISYEILDSVKYDRNKSEEIVDIISMHDADQLINVDIKKIYNTKNKKIFHDLDSLDRYTKSRLKKMISTKTNKEKIIKMLKDFLKLFFYSEFRKIAQTKLAQLEKEL